VSLYVDTSALLKLYVDEAESDACEAALLADPVWVTGRHTLVEARRNLARLLEGEAHRDAVATFTADWRRFEVIEVDVAPCERAAELAEHSGARTLDALHLAAALTAGVETPVTYDQRLAEATGGAGLAVSTPASG